MNTLINPTLVRLEGVYTRQVSKPSDSSKKCSLYAPICWRYCWQYCCLGLLLAMLSGCGDATEPEVQEAESEQEATSSEQEASSTETAGSTTGAIDIAQLLHRAKLFSSSETWHASYMHGKKIGYRHTHVQELFHEGQLLVLTNILEKQTMLRFGEKFTMEIRATQLQDRTGDVLQFSYHLPLGLGVEPMQGVVSGDTVKLRPIAPPAAVSKFPSPEAVAKVLHPETASKVPAPETDVAKEIAWPAGTKGFDGVEQSLLASPMQPGETRNLKMLQIPPLELISTIQLQAGEIEKTTLPAGEIPLLKIEQQVSISGGTKMLINLWTNEKGEVQKYAIPQLQQETFLTFKEQALDESDAGGFDLGNDLLVRLNEPMKDDPHRAKHQLYRITWKSEGVVRPHLDLFSHGLSQEVWDLEGVVVVLEVHAIRPDQPAKLLEKQPEPVEADLQRSDLVQSDDPLIMMLSESASQRTADNWEQAIALEKFVHGYLTEKNYSQAFASAADVAKSREGDCTEHAVLLAALCRANKIPARVAFGLVYVPSEQAFAFHMWNEIWIKDRWIPLDATLALGGIGAGHLKIGDSSLASLTALLDLLPVMQAMGQLKIDAVPPSWTEHAEKAEEKP